MEIKSTERTQKTRDALDIFVIWEDKGLQYPTIISLPGISAATWGKNESEVVRLLEGIVPDIIRFILEKDLDKSEFILSSQNPEFRSYEGTLNYFRPRTK